MKIIIIAPESDRESQIVTWGLRQLGCEPVRWDWRTYPATGQSTWAIGNEHPAQLTMGNEHWQAMAPFDVVWNRRHTPPVAAPGSHPDDVGYIEAEALNYLKNVVQFLGHSQTLWVNPLISLTWAAHKANQLVVAKAVGLDIPDTLISNDPAQVGAFLKAHPGGVVHKSFAPAGWKDNEGGQIVACTALVPPTIVDNPAAIRACPGIFQARQPKAYELRITVIGTQIFAAKITNTGANVDWRYDGDMIHFPLAATTLPHDIAAQCLALCRQLNIVFGCIDMIVTPSGEHIFLEVNQAGQFLWQEKIDPALPLLDAFCRFLASGGTSGLPLPTAPLTLKGWLAASDPIHRA
jgi:hypothetical protein